ncbi:MAG: 5-(carboxyamino)imidazole ribonucleotide synthase [gamma proteobacterium symbiont of Bathyaustriella thionipta]|nr:5-(carboxyamino)imidazole ribonucleotide synthase [gamma proteobacterium symbiont of Bathyaustriella thionipta]MCU7949945.1 5-(carboxyamino)imidazole ribonucleotide synthase [gamma proteobacterium symbiont of Bathyaustriella thionipta]MCU7952642.1 5-(carboxyamino)imidazole ribonucleotide synthase [gamma proteobacterium symbiont of Bathyaustriella thionipta]MCU7955860.1 5-(carboxyamino)imidazole ribonucleotide synthase [gamma proteobacterium symbiont of Bathyaustriella thionipta]MCU7965782.1 
MILPGKTLGMLGGGQLGRMFVMAAHAMGYHVIVLDPDPDSPAGRIADEHIHASYSDHWAMEQLANNCDAITTEFENIPSETLRKLEQSIPVRPSAAAVEIAQNRIAEKTFLADNGFETARFFPVYEKDELDFALTQIGGTAILKVASFGYDGKGQAIVNNLDEAISAFEAMGSVHCVLEEKVNLASEVSVVLARSDEGEITCYPVGENHHVNGILEYTAVPSSLPKRILDIAINEASQFSEKLEYCGIMAVEFFYTTDDRLLINEVAPRPHNSGHYTIDACKTSQFEQQVRMMCGLPAGSVELLSPVVMFNILGDIWSNGEPDWAQLLSNPNVKLHLYGKREARAGRKMGHFTCLGNSISELLQETRRLANALPKP